MNSEMANLSIQLNIKNKLSNKKNRDRVIDTESILMVARWEGDVEEWVKR